MKRILNQCNVDAIKKSLTIIILFCGFNLNSQISSGKIIYNIQTPDIETPSRDPKSVLLKKLMVENARSQSFVLEFSPSTSSFIRTAQLDQSNEMEKIVDKISSEFLTTPNNFFFNQNTAYYIMQTEDGILVRKPFDPISWEILTETKMIDNYVCYKAICNKKIVNFKGEEKNIAIVAWFAPVLPYSYGPKEFYGLPGLILELQDGKATFYASKISIMQVRKEIEFPSGKTISEEEYTKGVMVQKY